MHRKKFALLNTKDVVLTEERLHHIQLRHPEDYELFAQFGTQTILEPDVILKDCKNEGTIFLIRRTAETNPNTIIRLSIAGMDKPENANSVMTFYRLRDKNLTKLKAKNKVLYEQTKT